MLRVGLHVARHLVALTRCQRGWALSGRSARCTLVGEMSTEPFLPHEEHLELPVDELMRRARPLPPREEMVIDDLTPEEGEAFLAALEA